MGESAENAPGLIVRQGNDLCFLAAEHVEQILPRPPVSKIPTADFVMTLVSGRVVPAVEVGVDRAHALLCNVDGHELVLLGLSVVASGYFQSDNGEVRFEGRRVIRLDLGAPLAVLQGRFHS